MFYFCGLNTALREFVALTTVYHVILYHFNEVETVKIR